MAEGIITPIPDKEVECPICMGTGKVAGPDGERECPLCEGYKTVPEVVAKRAIEVATRRLPGGEVG